MPTDAPLTLQRARDRALHALGEYRLALALALPHADTARVTDYVVGLACPLDYSDALDDGADDMALHGMAALDADRAALAMYGRTLDGGN